jgi:FtsP/CotA-like multicopper oxidase with cupredoxin domain
VPHHTVVYDQRGLNIDGRATPISAAQFHYWQLPAPALWPDMFRRIRADGYNAVATDLYWGYHSSRPGAYDFSGIRDLDVLFDDAAREQLYVVVRSGPYIDGDANASGLPGWMLSHAAARSVLRKRYVLESREWFQHIDPIVARHQLTDGRGTIVLDQIDDRAESRAHLQRQARHDGVTVPFGSLVFVDPYAGMPWGWTSTPSSRGSYVAPADTNVATGDVRLPEITGWRTHADDDETEAAFNDRAWPQLLLNRAFDSDDGSVTGAPVARGASNRFFGVDDYGFHHGAVWYRGHFVASGRERAFASAGIAGRSGAWGVWLNGSYLGNTIASSDGITRSTFPIVATQLRPGRDNLLSVLFENAGHETDPNRDSSGTLPRGMLQAALSPHATSIAWQILGNGEYNVDPERGPLDAGGLAGEIAGWQNPSFSDRSWRTTKLPASTIRPGVVWYRTRARIDVPLPSGTLLALRIQDLSYRDYRASIFFNGWLVAHVTGAAGPVQIVPLPAGIASNPGENTIAIAVWNLSGKKGLGRISLTTLRAFDKAHVPLPDLPVVESRDGVARLQLTARSGRLGAPRLGGLGTVAPTIRLRAGDAIDIELHNELPRSSQTANAVNLHFHGLNVTPNKPGDDVLMSLARPGGRLHYRFVVPASQPPGLYWYHPHSHGETYWQVTSGMSGAIVVGGLSERIPQLRGMRQRIAIARDVQNRPDILSSPWYARRTTPKGAGIDPDGAPGPNESCLPEPAMHLTLNDVATPYVTIANGERQLFRIVNASAGRVLDLAVDNERIGVVGVDGYPVAAYPGNSDVVWMTHAVVPPAGRLEFIVTGQRSPVMLQTRCYDSGSGGDRDPAAVLAVLTPATTPLATASALDANRVEPQTRTTTISVQAPARKRIIHLTEDANGFYIDGRAFSMHGQPAIVAHAGTLEEWTFVNDTDEVHDMHVHQVHFVVESIDGKASYPRFWRDTVLVSPRHRTSGRIVSGTARVLVDFRNAEIRGTFVVHCHMLDHEDGGMMALVRVI